MILLQHFLIQYYDYSKIKRFICTSFFLKKKETHYTDLFSYYFEEVRETLFTPLIVFIFFIRLSRLAVSETITVI